MSKVKIQGSASGSGVLTIQAPTTSTDRTITLPDATATLATTADSVGGANGVDFNDDVKARFGTGNDLELYHNGSNSIIKNSTGITKIQADDIRIQSADDSESLAKFVKDGGAELYHNDSKKLETTATGIAVTGGVAIGGTGTANTLDDYEEGTWTPGFGGATISAGHTTGYYTKIGRQVFLIWYSAELQISSASGGAEISGLPFTASSVTNANSLFSYQHGTAVDGGSTGGYIQRATTKMHFVDTNGTAKASYINGTRYIMIAGTYFTD